LTDGRRIEVGARTTEEQKREEIEAARTEARASMKNYESVWHAAYARYQNRLMLSHLPRGGVYHVLDCGCGVGVLLNDLVTRYAFVHGLDISLESLELIERSHPALQRLVVGDAEWLPYRGGAFDAVLLRGTLHHLTDLAQGMREFRRVLKPGGVLVMLEPCSDVPAVQWGRNLLSKRKEKSFKVTELKALLSSAGFSILGLRRTGYVGFTVTYLLRELLAGLSHPASLLRKLVALLIATDEMLSRIPVVARFSVGVVVVGKAPG